METLKRQVDEIYGYKAWDGVFFKSADECKAYEESARSVAAKAAKTYEKKRMPTYDLTPFSGSDDAVVVYDIPDGTALQIVNTFLHLLNSDNTPIDPVYVGSKVATLQPAYDDYVYVLGSYEELIAKHTTLLDNLFADPT